MVEEVWRPVVGFNYEVSNLGRVRNTKTDKVLKTCIDKYGYLQLLLYSCQKRKCFRVHRLVARAFPEICGEWFEGCVINHKNEIKTDNRAENLETCSVAFNNSFGSRLKKCSKSLQNRSDESKSVVQYTLEGFLIAIHPSLSEASRQTGISVQCIYYACQGKSKTSGGFIWRYA